MEPCPFVIHYPTGYSTDRSGAKFGPHTQVGSTWVHTISEGTTTASRLLGAMNVYFRIVDASRVPKAKVLRTVNGHKVVRVGLVVLNNRRPRC